MLLGPAVSDSNAAPSGLNRPSLQASNRASLEPSAKGVPPGRVTVDLLKRPWASRIQPPGTRVN